jgi:hypothetical protein
VPITISPTTQQQIANAHARSLQLQTELNRVARSLNMSDQLYQFLSSFNSNVALLANGCQNLLVELRRQP